MEALYARYGDSLFTLALRLSGSRADAEDALHDLFVGLPELLWRYDERGRLASWLKAVIARLVLAGRRTARRRDELMLHAAADLVQPAAPESWTAIDLDRAIASLPDPLRSVFVLKQVEGYSHDDIAGLLGITSGAAGDSGAAGIMAARLVVDPRTSPAQADSLIRSGRAHLGIGGWDAAVADARRELRAALVTRAMLRPLRGTARLRDASGKVAELKELTSGEPAVVVFWSRECGAALEALPALAGTIPRLRSGGTPVLFVVEEEPSADLSAYLETSGISWPVYHDVEGTARRAFSNFGTPKYYVLDAAGRVRFDYADGEPELIAMVDALRGEGSE